MHLLQTDHYCVSQPASLCNVQAKALGQTRHFYMPRVTQAVRITHKPERLAKARAGLSSAAYRMQRSSLEGRHTNNLFLDGLYHALALLCIRESADSA